METAVANPTTWPTVAIVLGILACLVLIVWILATKVKARVDYYEPYSLEPPEMWTYKKEVHTAKCPHCKKTITAEDFEE